MEEVIWGGCSYRRLSEKNYRAVTNDDAPPPIRNDRAFGGGGGGGHYPSSYAQKKRLFSDENFYHTKLFQIENIPRWKFNKIFAYPYPKRSKKNHESWEKKEEKHKSQEHLISALISTMSTNPPRGGKKIAIRPPWRVWKNFKKFHTFFASINQVI